MIKRVALPVLILGMMQYTVQAQTLPFHLNSYTIPLNSRGAVIAGVVSRQGSVRDVKLVKDTSGLFTISRKGQLSLKKQASLAPGGAFQYEVTLQAGSDQAAFVLVKDEFKRNKVVAHRGAWKNNTGSENSLTSLKDAIRLGCEGSEFDVWLSSDNQIVLSHDPRIGGKVVEETPLAELQAIPLKNGDRVPTLEEYLQTGMTQPYTKLVLEMKPSRVSKERGQQLAAQSVAIVQAKKAQAWVYYISFDFDILKKVLELDPTAKVAYLNGDRSPEELKANGMWGFDYNFNVYSKDKQLIANGRKNGITSNIWTVNDPAQMDELLQAGVDFITTNEPEILLQKVGK